MMMNIRGLVLKDPEHTVHLQTLQFNTQTRLGMETEEIAQRQVQISWHNAVNWNEMLFDTYLGQHGTICTAIHSAQQYKWGFF